MAHPTRKHSRSRRDKGRAAVWRIGSPARTTCPQCAKPMVPHRVCGACGYYRGRQVITVTEKKSKKEKQQAAAAS
jgi:large subunit ribosomal protein L32